MKVTKNITIDLNNPRKNVVHLGQGDNQRQIILTLLKDGMPFDVSEGIGTATLVAGVHYIKANGVGGYYDWTSTDEAAVVLVTGTTNVWNVRIDEHATDVPGFAQIFVKFSLASGETLYSFPITLDVIRTSGGTTDPDKPYYHSSSFLLAGAQAEKTSTMLWPVGVDGNGKLWAEGGLTGEAKEALIACFEQVAWKTPYGQTYLSALETALYPEVHLTSITAAYEQDRPIYDTDSLDLVRLDLVVTANYSDGTSERLADDAYTLTGTLTAGTSTITVTYGGKSATVSVIVTPIVPLPYKRCEWISANSQGQVIDTGIEIGTGIRTITEAQYLTTNLNDFNYQLVGIGSGYSGLYIAVRKTTSGFAFGIASGTDFTVTASDIEQPFTVENNFDPSTPTATLNGQTISYTRPSAATSTLKLQIFAATGTSTKGAHAKFFKQETYRGTTLIQKLYPCYNPSTSEIGVYDVVGDTFIGNSGSGSFSKGDDA